jgi:hypothetical protein
VTTQFKSDKSVLNGLPHAGADISNQTAGFGAWEIDISNEALAELPPSLRADGGANKTTRLKSDVVLDIVLVYNYSVS